MRIYDPRLGRFLSKDPVNHLNIAVTPYSFAGNSPISNIDYNGLFKISPFFVSRYPNLAKVLAYVMPSFINDEAKMKSWMAELGITDKNVGKKVWTEMLTYGSGPYVTPTRMNSELKDGWNQPLANQFFEEAQTRSKAYEGLWTETYSNNLAVGFSFASDLESALKNGDAYDIGFRIFSAMVICIHEGGHWARNRAGLASRDVIDIEDGARAEIGFFGEKYTYRVEGKGYNAGGFALKRYEQLYTGISVFSKSTLGNAVNNFRNKTVPLGQTGDPTLKDNKDDENASSNKKGNIYTPDYKPVREGGSYL